MKYEWAEQLAVAMKSGVSLSAKVDANDVGQVIDQIRAENDGECRPDQLLEKSRSKRSPTHKLFEWDDTVAGERYRIAQASYAIRKINVVYVTPKGGQPKATRAVVSVRSKTGERGSRAYVSVSDAMNDREWRDEVLTSALNQLRQWRAKWFQLNEIADAGDAIQFVDTAIEKLQKVSAK